MVRLRGLYVVGCSSLWIVIGRSWLSAAMEAAGAFVIWGALAGWMGWISFPAIVMTTGDSQLSAIGARLSGFVQYPNFLGAVMSAYLVWFWSARPCAF